MQGSSAFYRGSSLTPGLAFAPEITHLHVQWASPSKVLPAHALGPARPTLSAKEHLPADLATSKV